MSARLRGSLAPRQWSRLYTAAQQTLRLWIDRLQADKETNYCARCQTGGKLLADRGLSRLLGADWPRTLDELETLRRR